MEAVEAATIDAPEAGLDQAANQADGVDPQPNQPGQIEQDATQTPDPGFMRSPSGQSDPSQTQDVLLSEIPLPPEYKEHPGLKDLRTVGDVVKKMVHAESRIGAEDLKIPGKEATQQEWEGVYNKLGRPESPDKYGLVAPEGVPADVVPPEMIGEYAQVAHEVGLNTKQAATMLGWYGELAKRGETIKEERANQMYEDTSSQLQQLYGNAYKQKVDLATSVFNNTPYGREAMMAMTESGMINSLPIIQWAIGVGERMGQDHLMGLDGQSRGMGAKAPSQAQAELSELERNPAMWDRFHPDFASLNAKRKKLLPDAFPDEVSSGAF